METSGLKQNTILFFSLLAFILMNIGKSLEMHNIVGRAKFHLRNNCDFKVWPVIVAEAGNMKPSSSGFELGPAGDSMNVFVPPLWSGRVWGRTGCAQDPAHGMLFWCMTGDCGSSSVECTATAGNVTRETTVATVKLRGSGAYDINITTQDYLPLTAGKSKEGQYEFHFCHPSSSRGDIGSINNHNNSTTSVAAAGNVTVETTVATVKLSGSGAYSTTSVAEFILGVLIAVVAAAVIAFFKFYFCQNTTTLPSHNA